MKITTIFSALSAVALMTTGTFAAHCRIVKQWIPAKPTIISAEYFRAPDDKFHLHQHLCSSTARCIITCENMNESEWSVEGEFNKKGKEIPRVFGKDKWTTWDPRKRVEDILSQSDILRDRFPETFASVSHVNKNLPRAEKWKGK
ncbi:hypothetical protein PspLS_02437 [Pyricularia sp. CBS 133598]|nr:hypothetical protein PspLS_02437 [Pyricularia sp. CBS 133598]